MYLNYDEDTYSQGYGKILPCFRPLAKNYILSHYITRKDFWSDIGYIIDAFGLLY